MFKKIFVGLVALTVAVTTIPMSVYADDTVSDDAVVSETVEDSVATDEAVISNENISDDVIAEAAEEIVSSNETAVSEDAAATNSTGSNNAVEVAGDAPSENSVSNNIVSSDSVSEDDSSVLESIEISSVSSNDDGHGLGYNPIPDENVNRKLLRKHRAANQNLTDYAKLYDWQMSSKIEDMEESKMVETIYYENEKNIFTFVETSTINSRGSVKIVWTCDNKKYSVAGIKRALKKYADYEAMNKVNGTVNSIVSDELTEYAKKINWQVTSEQFMKKTYVFTKMKLQISDPETGKIKKATVVITTKRDNKGKQKTVYTLNGHGSSEAKIQSFLDKFGYNRIIYPNY